MKLPKKSAAVAIAASSFLGSVALTASPADAGFHDKKAGGNDWICDIYDTKIDHVKDSYAAKKALYEKFGLGWKVSYLDHLEATTIAHYQKTMDLLGCDDGGFIPTN